MTRQFLPAERKLKAIERVYRRKAEEAEEVRVRRNAVIREAVSEGMSQAQVSEITGLHRSRIGQITHGKEAT